MLPINCCATPVEFASSPSVANAYRMWVPTNSVGVVPLKLGAVPDAGSHGPCQVSTWYHTAWGVGAVGLNEVVAVKSKVGVGLDVSLSVSGVIEVTSGICCTCASSITVTLLLPPSDWHSTQFGT